MNNYSDELREIQYTTIVVGTIFFALMSMLGGNAAVSRYMEKDTATVHKTKFLAHVSGFITPFGVHYNLIRIKIFSIVIPPYPPLVLV